MNKFNPHKHHRRSTRLDGWDYRSPGYYFGIRSLPPVRTQLTGCAMGGAAFPWRRSVITSAM